MELSNKERNRYSRHISLDEVQEEGQLKLKKAKVLIIGAGGLGCPILLYLSAAGVGTIGIIDFDKVDESNLQRQVIFNEEDVEKSKVTVAKQKLKLQNPHINIITYNERLTNKNAIDLFRAYDIIVDGTDNFSTRYLINDASILTGKPLVYGAIHKFEGQITVFNYQNGPSYRDLFPTPPSKKNTPSCSDVGVIGVLPGIIGTQQSNEVIKIILGIGTVLSGELLIYESLNASFTKITIKKTNFKAVKTIEEFKKFDYDYSCENKIFITKKEFDELPENTIVLDVRETWEIPLIKNKKTLNIPLKDLDRFINKIPKNKPVYVTCQKGIRSLHAIDLLKNKYGFKNLVNLRGGLMS